MSDAFERVWELSVERKVSLRTAAYILGIGRVGRATVSGRNQLMSTQVTHDYFKDIPLFRGFSIGQRKQIAEIAKVTRFQPGEVVVEQGRTSQELWVLLEGTCEVIRDEKSADGAAAPIVLATLEPYSAFGEMSFFMPAPHSASVKAQTRVKLICVQRPQFDELLRRQSSVASKLAINVIHSLAERMRRMDQWVVELIAEQNHGPKCPNWCGCRRSCSTVGNSRKTLSL